MEQRKMKGTEEMVSLLGLGCMRFPHETPGSDDIDVEKAEKMIDYAIKHGVNYFDTAYPYHGHQSEPFLGQAMKKYPRESFYLASKLPMWYLKKEADVARYFEEQLERCQVEYFDFYLCHAMNEERFQMLQEYHIFEKLAEYKSKGNPAYRLFLPRFPGGAGEDLQRLSLGVCANPAELCGLGFSGR